MNAAITNYEDLEVDYQVKNAGRNVAPKMKSSRQATMGRRRGKHPTSVNGIHRRRTKRVRW